ncbi:MAG: FAD-dependent monooxygenase [Agriterribacter sp.]
MKKAITIIGAGIGGLTTAMLLKQKGFEPTIYESAPAIQPVGAGIIMANNAMQIYKKAGIQHKIEQAGNKISVMKITDTQLKPLSVMELSGYESVYGVYNVAIHRAALQHILAEETGFENIVLSKRLVQIEKKENYKLSFEDGTVVHSDIVIGADGIKSVVRKQLFNTGEIRDALQVCWRGVCETNLSEKYQHEANELWGKGKRFGFVKISNNKIYWYAVANKRLVKENDLSLTKLLNKFHSDVLDIINATTQENIFINNLTDLRPISIWAKNKSCLVGDAAHATTPNMGQGACQAVEDAYTIAQLLGAGNNIKDAFAAYEKLRIKKAHDIVKRSWSAGKISHIENGTLIWLRNIVMKLLPGSANNKLLDKIFDISYISGKKLI